LFIRNIYTIVTIHVKKYILTRTNFWLT